MGRLAPTHSPLSFDDLCRQAFGSGLHPWEFYEYSLDEYLLRHEGLKATRKRELQEDYQHVQMLAYYTLLPWLPKSAKNKKIEDIVPNIYEERKTVDEKQKYNDLIKRYKKAGLLNGK